MKILVVPTIREVYRNQLEFSVDIKLIYFLKKLFTKADIEIYNSEIKNNYNLIIITGGNSSINTKKKDTIRNNINNLIFNFALKKKIKILGICHGAQYLAGKFGFKLQKKNNHIGNHLVTFNINGSKFKKIVNSFHNVVIKFVDKKKIDIFGIAEDNTIEAFHIKHKKILCIMWHPERYKVIKKFDLNLIKKFYATNSVISG